MANPSLEATRNGMGHSGAIGLSSPPRPMPLRAPQLERQAVHLCRVHERELAPDSICHKSTAQEAFMTLCPIAVAAGCKKCPAFSVCPLKSVLGDHKPGDAAEKKAPHSSTAKKKG